MKNLVKIRAIFAVAAALCAGCQTVIKAEKHAEKITPIQKVVKVNGEDVVITTSALISSGGWYADARSPLWATEALSGLDLGVATNGTVHLKLDAYNRDLSTNAVKMVENLSELASDITGKAVAAICACYGGGTVSATSKLGGLTIKDITGNVQAKLKACGATDANACLVDANKIASEVCTECCVEGACSE